jgi:K+-sensing histidine kinase KdpD
MLLPLLINAGYNAIKLKYSGKEALKQMGFSLSHNRNYRFWHSVAQCLLGSIALALLTFVCFRSNVNSTTVALLYLILIVLVSLTSGLVPSVLVSIIAYLCLDPFFTEPLFHLAMQYLTEKGAIVWEGYYFDGAV